MIMPKRLEAVNPYRLALNSGVSRTGYRPFTLGLDLGSVVDNTLNQVINWGESQIPTASSTTGPSLGSLDVVPYQNEVFNNVIVPISNLVNAPTASSLSYQQLSQMLQTLQTEQAAWLAFLHNTPWSTTSQKNRAAAAEQTLAPYWSLYIQRITGLMQNAPTSVTQIVTGTPPTGVTNVTFPGQPPVTPTTPNLGPLTAGFSTPTAVLLGIAILYLWSKR